MPGSVLRPFVAKQFRGEKFTAFESMSEGPVHALAFFHGFLLREGRQEGKHQFRIFRKGVQIVRLEEYTHGRVLLFQFADKGNAVYKVTRETRHALGDNKVVFAAFAGGNHPLEIIAVLQGCAGDALIGIDVP